MSEQNQDFFKKPAFIAAVVTAISLLFLPVFSFMGHGANLIDLMDIDLNLWTLLLLTAVAMSLLIAYLIYDNGKNEKLKETLKPEMREKLMYVPFGACAAFLLRIALDLGLSVLGLGFWLALLASAFIAFEEKIMAMIKK